jgi:hypothetical protein
MNASWVAIDLMEFAVRTEDAVQSPEAALEWLRSFRDTLLMEGRNSRPMPWAVELLGMADVKIAKKSIARMQGQIVKIYGKDCDVDLECSKKYGEKYEKLKNIIAAAATREGTDVTHSSESCSLERTTGCNPLTADGDIREDSQDITTSGNGSVTESGTSANHYDQVPAKTRDTRDDSRGRYAPPSCSPEDGNPAETAPSHGGSVASLEARQGQARQSQHGAGDVPPENVSAKPSPALPVPAKRPHGEFSNVMLTDDEFAKLCEKCQDADSLITELDQYIESQGKTKKYKSHYATLLNWSRRKAQEAKPKQGYKTAAEKDADVLKELAEYYDKMEAV